MKKGCASISSPRADRLDGISAGLNDGMHGRAGGKVDDDGARVGAGLQIALGDQLFVGGDDGIAPDRQVGGERAGRGQLRPRLQCAAQDHLAQAAAKLTHQGQRPVAVENEHVAEIDRLQMWFLRKPQYWYYSGGHVRL